MTARIALSLVLALASALALNWAFYRQHSQTSTSSPLSLAHPFRSLWSLFSNRRWLVGFVVGILGWVFYVTALRYGPLSLVQAASAGGIAVLVLLVWRSGGVALARRELIGVAIAIGGLIMLGLSLIGGPVAHGGSQGSWIAIALSMAAFGAIAAFFGGPGRRLIVAGAGLGIGAGFFYAAGDVGTKAAVGGGWWLLFVPAVLAAHSAGFLMLQFGFQRGSALATAGVASLFTNAAPIAAGMALFHEPLPGGARGALRVLAFVAVVAGGVLLTRRSGAESVERTLSGRRKDRVEPMAAPSRPRAGRAAPAGPLPNSAQARGSTRAAG